MRLLIILILILAAGLYACESNDEVQEEIRQEQYRNCTNACANLATDDYTVLHYCNEECKRKFLE